MGIYTHMAYIHTHTHTPSYQYQTARKWVNLALLICLLGTSAKKILSTHWCKDHNMISVLWSFSHTLGTLCGSDGSHMPAFWSPMLGMPYGSASTALGRVRLLPSLGVINTLRLLRGHDPVTHSHFSGWHPYQNILCSIKIHSLF